MKIEWYKSHVMIRLFGGKNTYPVMIEINWYSFGKKIWHGPFYDKSPDPITGKPWSILDEKSPDDRWGKRWGRQPFIWGTGGLLKLKVHEPSEGWRLWVYSRWGSLFHVDCFINRRKDVVFEPRS